jgi:two-component system heavy metal sensor histidine kinase CusS
VRRPPSLALRLTLLFGTAAALIFPCFGWFITRSVEQHFEAEDVAELQVIDRAVEEGLSSIRTAADLTSLERRFKDILVGHHRASMYLLGKDKRPIYASPGPDLSTLAQAFNGHTDGNSVHRWKDAHHSYRVMIRRVGENGITARQPYTIAIAVQIDYHLEFLEHFRQMLWIVIAGSIAIATLMGWIAVGRPRRCAISSANPPHQRSELNTRLAPNPCPANSRISRSHSMRCSSAWTRCFTGFRISTPISPTSCARPLPT